MGYVFKASIQDFASSLSSKLTFVISFACFDVTSILPYFRSNLCILLLNSESLSLYSFVIGVIDLAFALASAISSLTFSIVSDISVWFYSISVLCSVIYSNFDSKASYSKVK